MGNVIYDILDHDENYNLVIINGNNIFAIYFTNADAACIII